MKILFIVITTLALSFAQTPRARFDHRRDYDSDRPYRPNSPDNFRLYDNSGQYRPDNSGAYRADDGRYHPDNAGAYIPDDSGAYHGDYEKYKHQEGPFGGAGGGAGGSGGLGPRGKNEDFNSRSGGARRGGHRRPLVPGDGMSLDSKALSSINLIMQPLRPSGISFRKYSDGGFKAFGDTGSEKPMGARINAKITGRFGTSAIPKQSFNDNRNYAIIRKEEKVVDDGYHYLYETENKIYGEEQGKLTKIDTDSEAMQAQGYFEYTGPDNIVYRVDYTANENGFVPVGAHIPTPPPILEAILRSLQYQRSIGEL